jgi:anti-anti-sigma regulatory factor
VNVDIRWENDAKTIIRHTYSGKWDWKDFYTALEHRSPDLQASTGVKTLIDLREVSHFPSDTILHLRDAAKQTKATDGLIVVISNNSALMTLFHVFIRVYSRIGKRLRLVTNEEAAYALLNPPGKDS